MNHRLLLGYSLILLPLAETLWLGNTFSLTWHSPKLMYQISTFLVPIKMLLTIAGTILIYRTAFRSPLSYLHMAPYCIGLCHALLLSLVCLSYLIFGTKADLFRESGTIHVYTADAGAMAKSYHHFSLICQDDFGFYRLQPIETLDWLGEFSFQQQGDELLIQHKDYEGEHEKRLDIAGFNCDSGSK